MMDLVDVSITALQDVERSLRDYKMDLMDAKVHTGFSSVISECSTELGNTEMQLRDLESELAAEQRELEHLEGELAYTEKELDDAYFRESRLEGEIAQLENEVNSSEAVAYEAKKAMEFHGAQAQNAQYPNDAAEHQAAYAAAEQQYNQAMAAADGYRSQLAAARDDLEYERGRINKLTGDVKWFKREIFDKQQLVDTLSDRKYRLENKLSRLKDAFGRLEADIRNFNMELDRYVSASDSVAERLIGATERCILYIADYEDVRLV